MTRAFSIGRLAALCFVLLTVLLAPVAFADVELGPDVLVHRQEFVAPFFISRLAVLPSGGFLTSWEDGGVMHVKAASPFDHLFGPSKPLAPRSTASDPPQARLAAVSADMYVAVWTDAQGLRARFVNAAGVPQPTQLTIASQARGAAVASIPGGGFVVGWIDFTAPFTLRGTARAQRFNALGQAESSVIDLGKGEEISLAGQPGGAFAAAIYDEGGEPDYEIDTLRIVNPDGSFRGEPTVVREPSDGWRSPMLISSDAAGRLVGAFVRTPYANLFEKAVMARRFSPNGEPLGDEIVVYAPPPTFYYAFSLVDVAVRADGAFLVAWEPWTVVTGGPSAQASTSAAVDEDLGIGPLARAFDAGGLPLGPAFKIDDADFAVGGEVDASPEGWVATWVRASPSFDEIEPDPGIHARRVLVPCPGDELCLGNGRFRVSATWKANGTTGIGHPLGLAGDSGAIWFFSPGNTELVVKVLDGRAINGQFWVFYGSLTDVEFDLTVTDTQTGATRTYHNPQGNMASVADVEALPGGDGSALPSASQTAAPVGAAAEEAAACSPEAACLRQSRYRAAVEWRIAATGESGHGSAVPLTDETGTFWFFDSSNVELLVKVLDGRPLNGHHWVFYASLTDVEFDLTVTDTATGAQRVYHNPAGTLASRADTEAFPE